MTATTYDSLVGRMFQNQEVLQGWDAVMNVLQSALDAFLFSQWQKSTGSRGHMVITMVWCEGVNKAPVPNQYYTTVSCFTVTLAPPLFQFTSGAAEVTVTQAILAGSLTIGSMIVPQSFQPGSCNCQPGDLRVDWGQPEIIDVGRNPALVSKVPVSEVTGFVNPTTQSVVLDFARGAFTFSNMTITGQPLAALASQLVNWFAAHAVVYCLCSVDMRDLGAGSGLTPRAFRFNVVTTQGGNTLVQIMISTSGSLPPTLGVLVDEPIPTADGYTCSLMVSSYRLMNDILAAGFHNSAGFNLCAFPSGGAGSAWQARLEPYMHISGSFDYGDCCNRKTDTYSIYVSLIFGGVAEAGLHVFDHIQTGGNMPVTIDVNGVYPMVLSGQGPAQVVSIAPASIGVSVTGSCESEVKNQLSSILQGSIQNSLTSVSFASISLLAFESLLFPEHLVTMSRLAAPGDLLLVGTFQPLG